MQNMPEILVLLALYAFGVGAVIFAGRALDRAMPVPTLSGSAGEDAHGFEPTEIEQTDADGVPDVGVSDLAAHRH